jgi:hypothetical protein
MTVEHERMVNGLINAAGKCARFDGDLGTNEVEEKARAAVLAALSAGSALARAMRALEARDSQRGPEWHTGCGTRSPLCFLCEARAALSAWEEATGASLRDENLTTKTKGD